MSRINVHCDVEDMSYLVRGSGNYAGQPAVTMTMGKRDDNNVVRSIKAQMDRYGWSSKMRSGRTPLVFKGKEVEGGSPHDPCYARHAEAIAALDGVLDSRLTLVESQGIETPQEEVQDVADYYTVRLSSWQVTNNYDGDRETWHWFSRQARQENVEFVLGFEHTNEEELQSLQKTYSIPEKSIFIDPPGDTIEEVNNGFREVQEICKRNEWRVNPRVEFLEEGGLGDE